MVAAAASVKQHRTRLSVGQMRFMHARHDWVLLRSGRGFGKTFIGAEWSITMMINYPAAAGLITANSYDQLHTVTLAKVFERLNHYGIEYVYNRRPPSSWPVRGNLEKHDKVLTLRNGAQCFCRSLDNYDISMRGLEAAWWWGDEIRDSSDEAFQTTLACLRGRGVPRQGTADRWYRPVRFTTTPQGRDHIYERFDEAVKERPELAKRRLVISGSTHENIRHVGDEFIQDLADSLDPEMYEQEVKGEIVNLGVGACYTTFDFAAHVTNEYSYDPYRELYLSADFNVSPMCWVVMQRFGDVDAVVGEIVRRQPRPGMSPTESAAMDFCDRYGDHRHDILVYGDYYGGSRTTQTTRTDYDILVGTLRERQSRPVAMMARSADVGGNPPVVDRVSTVNARLQNAKGVRRLFIRPECKVLIRDLERVVWKESGGGKREIDKRDGTLTHASDALGYVLYALYGKGSGGVSGASRSSGASDWWDNDHGTDAVSELYA